MWPRRQRDNAALIANQAVENKQKRVRLLAAELDIRLTRSVEITRSIETKSGFIAAAAGLIATATVPAVSESFVWVVGVIPLGLAMLTVGLVATVLWPRAVSVLDARALVEMWIDADKSPEELEDYLLEVRTVEIEKLDKVNETRTRSMKNGFKFLICSLAALILVAALAGINPEGPEPHGKRTHTPSPTQTLRTS